MRYTPSMFKVWKNPLNMHGIVAPGVLVYVQQQRDMGPGETLYRLICVESRVVCRYLGTAENGGLSNEDVFEPVESLHNLLLVFKCWWLQPNVIIPPLVTTDRPVGCYETDTYPTPSKLPYRPGDIVTVKVVDTDQLGYVQATHKFGESSRLYYVYGFGPIDKTDPLRTPNGFPMYTLYEDDIRGPNVKLLGINKWAVAPPEALWWTRELDYFLSTNELMFQFLHFKGPRKGWEKDHFVSVPSSDGANRVPAKVIRQFLAPGAPGPDGRLVRKRMYQVFPPPPGVWPLLTSLAGGVPGDLSRQRGRVLHLRG